VAVHATPGLWNAECTSHGPFLEKLKGRGGPFAGGSGGAGQSITFIGATPLGHPLAPIQANWLDNHMFVTSTLIGFTVMERYPAMKVVVAHGKASWMQEVLEKMEASTRVIPLLHHYPVSTEPEEMWEHGNVMLGFDAVERMIQKLPRDFAGKLVWGSRYPHHDATSAWDAMARLRAANVREPLIARMMGSNAARQLAVEPLWKPGRVSSSR
jgi:predicted TIM-barrel fold metal-dependent hydrolase